MNDLQKLTSLVRYYSLYSTTQAGSGHPSTSLSAADLMTTLFFKYLHFDLDDPHDPNNDRVVFSKGHASPLFYALYAAAGVISKEELAKMRQFTSNLEGHPTPRFKYTEAATGSLGQGLSVGVGLSLAIRQMSNDQLQMTNQTKNPNVEKTKPYTLSPIPSVYVLLGDGEMAEGSVWEAIQIAAHYKLSNLIGILDVNRLAQSDETMYGHDVEAYAKRIGAFGWNTIVIDGHNISAIDKAIAQCQISNAKFQMPTMIIAKTVKGKGVSFIEDKDGWHGKALKPEEFDRAVVELGEIDFSLKGIIEKPNAKFQMPNDKSNSNDKTKNYELSTINYKLGDKVATRQAYGEALTKFGEAYPEVVALDADVKNSTFSEIFKKAFPERFYDMYIAEQNMVGAAGGFARLGFVPFASTFAAFLTRAYDQIRMAALSQANIKLVGSHAGVSIGEDGPSQMALEDFAMMRAVSGSVVLHPSDAVSTARLVEEMITHRGMVYMRTARPATAVIYDNDEEFKIGGSKVHRVQGTGDRVQEKNQKNSTLNPNPHALIIATGVCVHEALAAQKTLAGDGITATVIDCYSIKPIDQETILKESRGVSAVITVEDHWSEGGLGDAVLDALFSAGNSISVIPAKAGIHESKSPQTLMMDPRLRGDDKIKRVPPIYKLAVREMPRSGKPQELMDWAGISTSAIIKKVKEIIAQ